MPAVSVTDSYDALLTSTLANRAKQMWDNLVSRVVLLKMIEADVTKQVMSGHRVECPLLYGSNTTVGRRGDYDVVDTTKQDGITMCFVPWKDISGTITISDKEKAQNSGRERVLNLLEAKSQQLETSMRATFNTDLWSAGSVANQIYGLQYWLTTSTGTVASIDDSTNTWWSNQSTTSCGSFATNGRDKMRTLYNNCSLGEGLDAPDHIVTTQTVYEYFEKTLEAVEKLDLDQSTHVVNVGPKGLKFKGSTVSWDGADAVSGAMYFLNTTDKKIQWNVLTGMDFDSTPFNRPSDQRVSTSIVSVMGNLTFTVRKRQGVLTGITA